MKERLTSKKSIYIYSFLIPFVIYVGIGIILKLYPLSDNTVLFSDMNNQFISFYTYFKRIITTNNSFFYTFSKNLGGDMIGFAAYYLMNPYLFILFLFPDRYLPIGVYVMEILMLSTAGVTMQLFFMKVYGKGNLAFSTAYSMMGYVLAYFILPIFFCNIVLLPVTIMCLHKNVEVNNGEGVNDNPKSYVNRNSVPYILFLALSIITNYYIGYMLCLFLVVYFVYLCINNGTFNIGAVKRFVINSVLGVMLSCVYLVPVALSLRGQKNAPDMGIMTFRPTFKITGFYSSFLPCTFSGDYSNYAFPYVYVGAISMIFVVVFFITKRIGVREKIAALFILGAMFLSLYVHPLNVVWHAFNEPVGFAHRFAFYFSFILLEIGYRGWRVLSSDEHLVFMSNKSQPDHYKIKSLLYGYRACILNMMLVLLILELSVNAVSTIKFQISDAAKQSKYQTFYDNFKPVVDEIKQYDQVKSTASDSLYRIEKDFQYNMEDAMTYDYIGLTHNSSCETDIVKNFMGKMGFRNQGIWAFYNQGSTTFADCFLGVKYFISKFDTTEKEYNDISASVGYSKDSEEQKYYAFENTNALKLGSFVNSTIIESVDMDTDNLFEVQNQISAAYNFSEKIYNEASISEIRVCGNVELSDEFKAHAAENDVEIKYVFEDDTNSEEGQYIEGNGFIEFDVDIMEGQKNLYMYFTAPGPQGARIYVDGLDWEEYFSDWRWAIEKAGSYSGGAKVPIRMVAVSDSIVINNYYLYEEDLGVLNNWHEAANTLGADSVNLYKLSSSHIKGDFEATEDSTFVMSIPYDKGWHIKVDGKKVEQKEALSALMAFYVSEGYHEIEMYYIPQGMIIGAIVSVLSLILIIYCVACHMDREQHLGVK